MGSLLSEYPNATEFVTDALDEETLENILLIIVQFLGSKDVKFVHIDYGFSLQRDLKGQPQPGPRTVALSELESVVKSGLEEGSIEWNADSDFVFSAIGAEMRCMLCNDADLHFASVDSSLLMELARSIGSLGVAIYDDGAPITI